MKCHWAREEDGTKFWIPGCPQGFYTEGKCACRIWEKERQKQWEKEALENNPEYKARIENKELWKENARLQRIIEKLCQTTLKK